MDELKPPEWSRIPKATDYEPCCSEKDALIAELRKEVAEQARKILTMKKAVSQAPWTQGELDVATDRAGLIGAHLKVLEKKNDEIEAEREKARKLVAIGDTLLYFAPRLVDDSGRPLQCRPEFVSAMADLREALKPYATETGDSSTSS